MLTRATCTPFWGMDAEQIGRAEKTFATLIASRLGLEPTRVVASLQMEPAEDGINCWTHLGVRIDGRSTLTRIEIQTIVELFEEFGMPGMMPMGGSA